MLGFYDNATYASKERCEEAKASYDKSFEQRLQDRMKPSKEHRYGKYKPKGNVTQLERWSRSAWTGKSQRFMSLPFAIHSVFSAEKSAPVSSPFSALESVTLRAVGPAG